MMTVVFEFVLWRTCMLNGNPQDIFEYIKCYEQIGKLNERERKRTYKLPERKQFEWANAPFGIQETDLNISHHRPEPFGCVEKKQMREVYSLHSICVCWCTWSIEFYILPSGLNRRVIMVRRYEH